MQAVPKIVVPILIVLLLGACQTSPTDWGYERYLERRGVGQPTLDRMKICHGYSCDRRTTTSLSASKWGEVERLFGEVDSAAAERAQIAEAIGLLERQIGKAIGTGGDIAGVFTGLGGSGQQDCIDEATNTSTYLVLMENNGLLKWHAVGGPAGRGFYNFGGGWPHHTATIVDRETGIAYAVDSWFHDNGKPAEVVPLRVWLSGWHPGDEIPSP